MFDIGFSEIVLLMLIGLIVLGPKRLPVAIRTVMGWIKTVRGLAANVQNELKQELKLQELQESIKKAEQLNLKTLSPELGKTVEELKEQAKKIKTELEQKATTAGTTVEEQIREIKSAAENPFESKETSQSKSASESLKIAQDSYHGESDEKETTVDPTALEAHEQAELTERLSDYYPPDDDVQLASETKIKS